MKLDQRKIIVETEKSGDDKISKAGLEICLHALHRFSFREGRAGWYQIDKREFPLSPISTDYYPQQKQIFGF